MPTLQFEAEIRRAGYRLIAGIDEAGRGPLAGPVVAAAVVLPTDFSHSTLNDSKQLSPKRRDQIHAEITGDSRVIWSVAVAEADEIDRINILRATHEVMRRAVLSLPVAADAALIDGLPVPNFPVFHRSLVNGDSLSLSIAAASVIAKVERDRIMAESAKRWPGYGFETHKGYGTAAHLEALKRQGPCPIHRRSFRPVAETDELF